MATVSIDIDGSKLASDIVMSSSRQDCFELIKAIDDKIQEYDFTEMLRDHFAKILDREDELDSQAS